MFGVSRYDLYMESSIPNQVPSALAAVVSATNNLRYGGVADAAFVVATRQLLEQVNILCTHSIAGFAATAEVRGDGFRNVSEWLAGNTHALPGEGEKRLAQARVFAELDGWSDAAAASEIGVSHVDVVAGVLNRRRLDYLRRDSLMLLGFAKALTWAGFRETVAKWASACDDALGDPASDQEHEERRRVQLSPMPNGMWSLNGLLDALGGEALRMALEAGMPKPCKGDNRTPAQRRHDALVDIANESLANEDRSDVGGERPHVMVTIDAASGIAYTSQMYRLSSFTRDMLLCDCVTTSVWLNAKGVPFDVGTPDSAIPMRNRRAVLARDQHCRAPGCWRPARWTDVHHIRERERRGTHEIENLCALCKFHHRWVHKHNIKIRWDRDHATLIFEWPDGRVANSPPPPQILFAR